MTTLPYSKLTFNDHIYFTQLSAPTIKSYNNDDNEDITGRKMECILESTQCPHSVQDVLLMVECIHFSSSKDQYFLSYEANHLQIDYVNFNT